MDFLLLVLVLESILAIALIGARQVFRFSRSISLALLAGLVLMAAPWWDLVPGGIEYLRQVRKDGGTRIFDAVRTGAYVMDFGQPLVGGGETAFRICMTMERCYQGLFERGQTVEMLTRYTTDPTTGALRLSLAREPDPRCELLAEYSASKQSEFWTLGKHECFAVEEIAMPTSRYEIMKREDEDLSRLTYHLFRERESVVERVTERLLAERVDYHFSTWENAPWPPIRMHLAPPKLDYGDVLRPLP
jgi:hypothetical protein